MKVYLKRYTLSAYQIKIIALVFMTIDHIAAYGFEIPVISKYYSVLRILGRISAPLFLYMVTESVRYTNSRSKYLLRLYFFAVITGVVTAVMNECYGDILGVYSQSNIFFTYFYTVLYIELIEKLLDAVSKKDWIWTLLAVVGILSTYVPHIIRQYFYKFGRELLIKDLFDSVIQSPLMVEYSPLFILLGILIYFSRTKWIKIFVFLIFCFVSHGCVIPGKFGGGYLSDFLGYPQYWMVLATPIMLLYNGEKGNYRRNYLFYIYYPVHIYVIIILVHLVIGR